MVDQSTTMDIICKTYSSCFTMVPIPDKVNQAFSCNSRVRHSTNWWNNHHSDIYTYDAKFTEFLSWYHGNTLCCSSHGRSAGEIDNDLIIWDTSGCCWLSMVLWIVFSSGIVSYSYFKAWPCISKEKVFVKRFKFLSTKSQAVTAIILLNV